MHKVYVASYKGEGKLFNRLVRWLDNTVYSHTEIALQEMPGGLWLCCSSSMMDGGVRLKAIDIHSGNWDLIEFDVDEQSHKKMLTYCADMASRRFKYDFWGMIGAGFVGFRENKNQYFCNEFVGFVMGFVLKIPEPYRLRPASFHNQMLAIKSAKAGGSE